MRFVEIKPGVCINLDRALLVDIAPPETEGALGRIKFEGGGYNIELNLQAEEWPPIEKRLREFLFTLHGFEKSGELKKENEKT